MDNGEHSAPTFSFVVPVYNEQEVLDQFCARLTAAAEGLGEPYEVIFVDDGSNDGTDEKLQRLAEADCRIRVVTFSRNFGHQVAVTAGYDHAAGRAVISLDADCQHPPEMIPELVARWREGFEVVYTIRKDTAGISLIRRAVGRLVYRLISVISGADLTDQADFRLLDRKAVDAVKAHRQQAPLLRGLVQRIGFRQAAVPYVAERRAAGNSKYTLRQLGGMAGAGMFNFSLRPLRLATLVGAILLAAATCYAICSLVLWPLGHNAGIWVHLVALVLGMFGLEFLLLGILGEYVGRTFDQTKQRPLYIVRQKSGFPEEPEPGPRKAKNALAEETQRFSVFT